MALWETKDWPLMFLGEYLSGDRGLRETVYNLTHLRSLYVCPKCYWSCVTNGRGILVNRYPKCEVCGTKVIRVSINDLAKMLEVADNKERL